MGGAEGGVAVSSTAAPGSYYFAVAILDHHSTNTDTMANTQTLANTVSPVALFGTVLEPGARRLHAHGQGNDQDHGDLRSGECDDDVRSGECKGGANTDCHGGRHTADRVAGQPGRFHDQPHGRHEYGFDGRLLSIWQRAQ